MTEEVEQAMDFHRKVVRPEDAMVLHSLELLLDVAENLLSETSSKDKVISTIRSAIYEEKLKTKKED